MLCSISYKTSNWRLYNQRGSCYVTVAICLQYNKKYWYIAHPNLPDVRWSCDRCCLECDTRTWNLNSEIKEFEPWIRPYSNSLSNSPCPPGARRYNQLSRAINKKPFQCRNFPLQLYYHGNKTGILRPSESGKTTPCQIPTYTGISRDNPTCDLSYIWHECLWRDIPG